MSMNHTLMCLRTYPHGRPMQRHFSLLLATVGRFHELDSFFHSLTQQTYAFFSVVLVDQNDDETFLRPLIERYTKTFKIIYLRSPKGLSRARNLGLKYCIGDIVCFPDDDCEYPKDLLFEVNNIFNGSNCDIVIGRQTPLEGYVYGSPPSFAERIKLRFSSRKSHENIYTLFSDAPSISLFFSQEAVLRTGNFDETLGAGAGTPWGSGEDTDYIVRAHLAHCRIERHRNLAIRHPTAIYSKSTFSKALAYGRGRGRLLRKHELGLLFCLQNIAYPILKGIGKLPDTTAMLYYFLMSLGRVHGFFQSIGQKKATSHKENSITPR